MLRSIIVQISFLILLTCGLAAQEKTVLTWSYGDLSFKEFAAKLQTQNKIRIYYKDEWISEIRTGPSRGDIMLTDLLDELFQGKSLYYFIDSYGNLVVTKNFAVKQPGKQQSKDNKFMPPSELNESQAKDQVSGNVFHDVGDPKDKDKAGNATITGYITNKDTKEPIPGVTIFVKKLTAGAISNEYGFFSISLPRGSHILQFSFIGMREKQIGVNLYGSGDLNVDMTSVLIPLKETVVTAQKNMTLQRYEVGMEKINATAFKLMPTSLGEADIIKSFLLIPGVQSVGEGSAGFNVRGGSADQNLILLYGAPVYNSSHFFGFFSAVNSDIIREATMYKGGIPSRYGGRISSVLDIAAKEGNRKSFDGNAGISPITTHIMVEGPIKKDTITYIFTARTTYSNWVLGLIDNPALNNSKASFYDLNGEVTWDIDKKNKIDLAGYLSHDSFRFNSDTTYSYNNAILTGRWRHFFNSRFFSLVSLTNSNYRYDVSSVKNKTEGFNMDYGINTTGLKADFNLYHSRHEFNFGSEILFHNVLPGRLTPAGDSSWVMPDQLNREKAVEPAVYFEDKITLNDNLSLNAGLRFSSFFALGPSSVMIYDPAYPKNLSTITDTLHFGNNKVSKSYAGPEFRISLNYKLSPKNSIKFNYNRTRQYIHLLTNTTSISPTDSWKLCDYYLKPQIGDQVALGFYNVLSKVGLETSAEVYYKVIRNMIDFKGGTNIVMDRNVEKDIVNARGKAYGIELMLKKTEGKIRGAISYTYSRTFLQSTGVFSDETINGGKWFPASFDKPHDLVIIFNYLLSRRFSFSANYLYSTGRPITYPVTVYYLDNLNLTHYSDRNKYRIPYYSRLDLSVKISGSLKSHKTIHPNWIFSVYNVFGRQNVYSIYFKQEGNAVNGYKLSVFGQAIPTITFNFDFGKI
jgi:hypothetical protein